MNEYKDRVKRYRLKYGITQQEFADKCGVTRATINIIETAQHHYVNMVTRHKLEKVLKGDEDE